MIRKAVSEMKMFENNGHIHVYSPEHGVQRRMISVVNIFVFLRLLFLLCCCFM